MEINTINKTTEITITINEQEHALLLYIFACIQANDNKTSLIVKKIYNALSSVIDKPYQLTKYLADSPEMTLSSSAIMIPTFLNLKPNFIFKDNK